MTVVMQPARRCSSAPLEKRLAVGQELCSEVLRIFLQTVFTRLRRRARRTFEARKAYCGAVSFSQRRGGSMDLDPFETRDLRIPHV